MTVGELQVELAKLDPEVKVSVLLNGSIAPVIGVTAVPGASFMLLRGHGKGQKSKNFTVNEEGLIGHLVHLGFTDEQIGEVLERPAQSVERKRKALGL